jgi:hypothetical protein
MNVETLWLPGFWDQDGFHKAINTLHLTFELCAHTFCTNILYLVSSICIFLSTYCIISHMWLRSTFNVVLPNFYEIHTRGRFYNSWAQLGENAIGWRQGANTWCQIREHVCILNGCRAQISSLGCKLPSEIHPRSLSPALKYSISYFVKLNWND